jgi:uncharacterized surface protein with fasciclin (FAS1) repeats
MKKNYSKLMVAGIAVLAIVFVGCSNSDNNPINSNNSEPMSDMVLARVAPPQADVTMETAMKSFGRIPIYPLAQKSGFKILGAAIEAVELQRTLTVEGPFTVFAPTDEAFMALPEGTLEALLQDPEALTNILLYHVVAGEVYAADVVNLTEATTLNGDNVSISTDMGVMVNDANVIATDIKAKNGVIHVIDKVLIP